MSIAVTEKTDAQRRMLNPRAVALIGASEKEGSVGRAILENLLLSKNRKIFPVNPNRTTILGIPTVHTRSRATRMRGSGCQTPKEGCQPP